MLEILRDGKLIKIIKFEIIIKNNKKNNSKIFSIER